MRTITLKDLQEIGRLLNGVRYRLMIKKEIASFGIVPEGATKYTDFKAYITACQKLNRRNATYESGSNPAEGLYWIKVEVI